MATEPVVFKKKSKRNFRKKNLEEENEEELQASEPLSEQKTDENVEKKAKKSSKPAPKTLLSFDHGEDEDEEVFKVKKSKESRRLSKQRVKSKKTRETDDEPLQEESSNTALQEDESKIDVDKLKNLRKELSNLGGEDDLSENVEIQSNADKVIKSDGIIFKPLCPKANKDLPIHIPDAAAIHAARKREMARQMGSEYLPVDDTDRYSGRFEVMDKSRLVREDDNDHSDEDPDKPLGFGTKKSNHPDMKRRLEVEAALAEESGEDSKSEGEDDALRKFEEEQIRKAVSIPQSKQEEDNSYQMYLTQQYLYSHESMDPNYIQHNESSGGYPSYPPTSLNAVTMDMIWEKMNNRIVSLQEVNRGRHLEREKMTSQAESCEASITSLEEQMKDAEGRYGFFQEMRGYVRDLIECLNEKVPLIDDLESRMHMLLKQRTERLIERRQKDVQDQAETFAAAQTGKPVQTKPELDEFGRDKSGYLEQAKQRRAVEREARRSRRRKERENSLSKSDEVRQTHHEGFSSDDEEGSGETLRIKNESEKIRDEATKLFEDVIEDFGNIKPIIDRFQLWKYGFSDTYKQAFVHLCLPKLVLPFVRVQLLDWNPLEKNCKDFEEMQWFEDVMFYGVKDNSYDENDEDTNFIPRLVEKALLPKLTAIFENIWDPLSAKQTSCAVSIVKRLVFDYPTISAEKKHTQALFSAVITRLKKCINDDIYVPLYPKFLLEKKSLGAEIFVERQFWSCVKLLSNIFLWHGLISTSKLQELAVDGVLNRYLLLALQHASGKHYENVVKCQAIVMVLPRDWFEGKRRTTVDCLGSFSRYLENLASSIKLKAEGSTAQEKKKLDPQ